MCRLYLYLPCTTATLTQPPVGCVPCSDEEAVRHVRAQWMELARKFLDSDAEESDGDGGVIEVYW